MEAYITKNQAIHAMEQVTQPECFIEDTRKNFARIIEELPAADVVEVVRCKDCKHKQVDEIIFALSANPETALFCKHHGGVISETFYCSAGERKDGDKS